MKDEVSNKFKKQVRYIMGDCQVSKEVAQSDSKKYGSIEMQSPGNKGLSLYYDRSKVGLYKNNLEKMLKQLPINNFRFSIR